MLQSSHMRCLRCGSEPTHIAKRKSLSSANIDKRWQECYVCEIAFTSYDRPDPSSVRTLQRKQKKRPLVAPIH